MKVVVKETFEQGLPRAQGGAVKFLKGEYAAKDTEHGIVVSVGGKERTLPKDVVKKLSAAGLIAVA